MVTLQIKMKLIYFIVIGACVFYTTMAYEKFEEYLKEDLYDVRLFANVTDDRNCTAPGLMCRNCKQLVNCVLEENGEFIQQEVQSCDSDQTCLRDQCTTQPNPGCITDYKFECSGTGVFPDPFDCRKFHYCVKPQSSTNDIEIISGNDGKTTLLCDKNYGYDPTSTYCKVNLTNGCPDDQYPVPICEESGQSGALINKSIYYVCVVTSDNKLIPRLYLCSHGRFYENNKCT